MKYLSLIATFLLGVYEAQLEPPIKETDVPDERAVDLTDKDFENGRNLILEGPDESKPFPLTNDIIEDSIEPSTEFAKRAAVSSRSRLWPNGIVPYSVGANWQRNETAVLARAIQEFNSSTCVKWTARTTQTEYVLFEKSTGCTSHVGKAGGRQKIFLNLDCLYVNYVLHEMMHAIGFGHEHARPDREQYVHIPTSNILPGVRGEFDIQPYTVSLCSYDFHSITHYPQWHLSRGGQTISVKLQWRKKIRKWPIGLGATFTQLDIQKISTLYRCNQTTCT